MNPPKLLEWLSLHGIDNPHSIPDDLKEEFKELFSETPILWPQPGGQVQFQNCPADICLYGGEAGAGKSWNMLLDHLKWIHIPDYNGTIVRKTYAQIFDAGGLWDEAKKVFT
ncbi:MAG: hypothetical protein JRC86_13600, partial [Deltaproteobacteria bacterium]|nr:hypothetical protein [Deltaproteobacteria bacterium]